MIIVSCYTSTNDCGKSFLIKQSYCWIFLHNYLLL
uniref:Uncharacterized protein n=1 Tax=Lepeophtheirus salmonis TaxID=72036 RepID=A0A0K2V450_LEPSM